MIVLDTHALLWWVSDPGRLAAKARRLVDGAVQAGQPLAVSAISLWEIAMLVQRGRLTLSLDFGPWLTHLEALPHFDFVPVDTQIAVRSVWLDKFPRRDPADRIIVATALTLGATLVTADRELRSYRQVKTVWS